MSGWEGYRGMTGRMLEPIDIIKGCYTKGNAGRFGSDLVLTKSGIQFEKRKLKGYKRDVGLYC